MCVMCVCARSFACVYEGMPVVLSIKSGGKKTRNLSHYIYFFEIVNAKELCQLCDCDDVFDGYIHYTISFFSTFTSLEFFLLNGNVHVHQEMCLKRKL